MQMTENKAQAHQASHDETTEIERGPVEARELDRRRAGRLNEQQSSGRLSDTQANVEDRQASEDVNDPHRRDHLTDAAGENHQHPFNSEVAAEVDRSTSQPQHGDEAVTTEEYGEPVGQSWGESDEHGDVTTPRLPESGHTEEEAGRPHRRGDRRQGPQKDQRGGVTGH
jgi:hypothetical protein